MRFGLGITLYHPDADALSYLNELGQLFQQVYIFDNSPSNNDYLHVIKPEFHYDFTGQNRGLSVAFNSFLKAAADDGIDYLLLLDQDSLYKSTVLQDLMNDISKEEIRTDVAIHACTAMAAHLADSVECVDIVEEAKEVISSGSFINIHAVKQHDLSYDERLFVDYVDWDFCKMARKKGLKVLCHRKYVVPQSYGYFCKNRICHSAVRHYYMARDLGYYNDKYYSKAQTAYKSFRGYIKEILCEALREDDSWKKVVYATRGYWDYLRGVTGEYKRKT